MVIERKNLRSQVREELLNRMRTGAVRPGEGINEVQLAQELGVSRTPLREALIALESEGQIRSENGKGFRFMPLSSRELEDLAPIIATLEGLALSHSPLNELRRIGGELQRLAAEFNDEVVEHRLIVSKDDEWHALMLSTCTNQRLLDLVATVRSSFHRYESLLIADEVKLGRVAAEHATIAQHLIDGDIPAAQAALMTNWMNGMHRILDTVAASHLTD